jgi:hypothetical protein
MLGNGTSITKIKPTAAIGMIHSAAVLFGREAVIVVGTLGAITYVLCPAAARAF